MHDAFTLSNTNRGSERQGRALAIIIVCLVGMWSSVILLTVSIRKS